jgi:hypothetical protein
VQGESRAEVPGSGHPWGDRLAATVTDSSRPSARLVDAELRSFYNSSFPVGQNDAAVWQGKGMTTAWEVGGFARWRGVSVSVRPSLIFTQNASFELTPVAAAGMPIYANPWRRIDVPQRFGPDAAWKLDPGQSEVSLAGFGARVSYGTMSRWWGPAIRNPIVMSNNAPGFPHAALGTDGPRDVGIGTVEVLWLWGDLETSEWFLPSLASKDRFVTGIVGVYSPSFLSGLSLGATRVFYGWKPDGGVDAGDYFLVLQGVRKEYIATPENPTGDDEHDQMLSLFGRWVIDDGGFEVYGEWARNDHSWNFRDFALDPGHSQGITIGFQKAIDLSSRIVALRAEVTNLDRTDRTLRVVPTYYAHHIVLEGYTNQGEVIGAGIGPGGTSQYLAADLYSAWGRVGISVQRDVRDNDAFYDWAEANGATRWERNVRFHGGASALVFTGDFDLGGGLTLTREFNRYYVGRDLWNLNLSLSARWRAR